ncbi:hypothetical protein VNO78_06879 [Psophocarpus tetragonolobus]|uniref:Pentatricopeptide repeat-containing protein n=1 Tax=Psophocarpus tetragonolobus TaxID=3891 RepID=A0AAN9SU35_PSOTE
MLYLCCRVKTGLIIGYAYEPKDVEHTVTIRCLCLDDKLGVAVRLRGKMVQKGVMPYVFMHNHIVNGLCKIDFLERADLVVKEMLEFGPRPNCATYITLIKGYCVVNGVDRALYLFSTMAYAGIMPNRVTCSILVHALCEKGLLIEAKRMFKEVLKDDDEKDIPDLVTSTIFMDSLLDPFTYNILIGARWKEGKISEACYTLGVMSNIGIMPDQITYQLVIRGLCFDGEIMLAFGVSPNIFTYNALILAQVKRENFYGACSLKEEMISKGLFPDMVTYNLLIGAACNFRPLDYALQLYHEMVKGGYEPDLITYTELVRGLCIRGKMKRAEELYHADNVQEAVQVDPVGSKFWTRKELILTPRLGSLDQDMLS